MTAATPTHSPSILYVVGPGRGGSTLFERLLNSSPEAFALGEFHCLWRLPRRAIVCACGAAFDDCGFWGAVMARSGLAEPDLAELRRLEQQVARSGFVARRGLSLRALADDPMVQAYLALQQRVFDAVADESGATCLVDSSKAGPRAWLLATQPANVLLRLRRDAVDVLSSWRQPKWDPSLNAPMHKPSVAVAGLDWWKAEAWAAALARRRPVQRLDYARLVERPREQIERSLGDSLPAVVGSIQWLDSHSVQPAASYHSLNGNPDRFDAGPIRIRARPPALDKLSPPDRLAVRLVGGLLDRVSP
jgi:hypothetical protein